MTYTIRWQLDMTFTKEQETFIHHIKKRPRFDEIRRHEEIIINYSE